MGAVAKGVALLMLVMSGKSSLVGWGLSISIFARKERVKWPHRGREMDYGW